MTLSFRSISFAQTHTFIHYLIQCVAYQIRPHFVHKYLSPVVISMAPLKFPIFQQDSAARSKQPNAAFCSCGVGCDIIKYVTQEHTCRNESTK